MKSEFIPLLSLCIEDRRIVEGGSAEARRLSYLSLEHVEAQTGRLLKEPEDAVADEGKSTTFYYDERHVLYGKLRPYLNKVALPDQPGRCTTEIIPLLPTPGTSREYLSYLLRRPEAVELAMRDTTGSRMPRASMKELMKMMVPKHGPNEQNRIAGLLTGQLAAVEKARKAAAERVAAAGRLEAKLLLDAFHGIVPVALDSDEVGERKGWSWKLITKLARLESGHTPSRNHPEWWHGDVEWLQLSDVRRLDGEVAMRSGERTNELGLANSAARLLPKGTVCLSRTASVGFTTIMGREMATSQDFANWVCGEQLDPRYLMYAFMASRHFFRGLSSGATHKTVYMPTIKSLQLHVPSLAEQRSIADRLEKAIRLSRGTVAKCNEEGAVIEALPGKLLGAVFGGG